MPLVELKDEDGILSLEARELEDEIRHGRVPCTAEIRHASWTGPDFARIEAVPALAEAVDAPDARAVAWFQRAPFPGATLALCGLVLLAFGLQSALSRGEWSPLSGALGFEPTLLDGAWWSVWTAPWLHAGAFHALSNLVILAYCSFRVERAMGPGGLVLVLVASMLGATLLILPFSSLPVVGSSILAYGAWGAQFGAGLRFGELLPARLRGAYGWGTFLAFPFLLLAGVSAPHVSLLAHMGGYAGGLIAALFGRPEILAPRAAVGAARLRVLATALLLLALPAGIAWGLGRAPGVLCPTTRTVGVPKEGLELSVCSRMSDFPATVAGLEAWKVGASSESAVFAAFTQLRRPERIEPEWLRARWARTLGGSATFTEGPAPREGWLAWTFVGTSGTVEEHLRVEGTRLYRVGWYSKGPLTATRRALYERVLDSVRITEPEALRHLREKATKPQASAEATYRYAAALEEAGRYDEAMGLYEPLSHRDDGWEWEATRGRFHVCAYHPGLPACGGGWREEWLKKAAPDDFQLHLLNLRWLAADSRCPEARKRARQLTQAMPDLDADELKDALAACDN